MKKHIFVMVFCAVAVVCCITGAMAELTPQEFIDQFVEANSWEKNTEKARQLVKQNPESARQAYEILKEKAKGEGNEAEGAKSVGNALYQILQELEKNDSDATDNLNKVRADSNILSYQDLLVQLEQYLEFAKKSGNKRVVSIFLNDIGITYAELGQYNKALDYLEESLIIKAEFDDLIGKGNSLSNIGLVYMDLGQYEKSLECYEQALNIFREFKNQKGEGGSLGNIGLVYRMFGQYEKAILYFEQALAIHKEIKDKISI